MDFPFLLNIISTLAVIIALAFGLMELRHYHLSRKRDSELHLLNTFQTVDFLQGIWSTISLPDGLTKVEIEDQLGNDIKAVYLVMSTWENIGILVFHDEVSMDMVDDAYSGAITLSWQKLAGYVSDMREEFQRDTIFEWFQWLAERMADRERSALPVPAHIAHKDWEGS
jgi:hypothetical protein